METSDLFPSQPVCPSLGMKDDPRTSFRYPTLGNYCCYCQPPATPHLEHQAAYCFHAAYKDCPVHQQPADQPLPAQFRARIKTHARPVMRWVLVSIGILLLLIVGWQTLSSRFRVTESPVAGVPAGPTVAVAVTQTALPAPSPTSIPPSQTPVPQNTPLPTALPANVRVLDVPFQVGDHSFLIHQVREGENFETLEFHYDTTSDVLLALNDSLSSPLWANSVILISPGLKLVDTTLPAFQPHHVTDDEVSMDELARFLDTDVDLLRYYNNCLNDCQFGAGDWIIVPRPDA